MVMAIALRHSECVGPVDATTCRHSECVGPVDATTWRHSECLGPVWRTRLHHAMGSVVVARQSASCIARTASASRCVAPVPSEVM